MSINKLYLFYFLVSNYSPPNKLRRIIPYDRFEEISPSYENRKRLQGDITLLRGTLEAHGFYVENVRDTGYLCKKREVAS